MAKKQRLHELLKEDQEPFFVVQKRSHNLKTTHQTNNKTTNPIFLHVPAKTASLLLEAALRIHQHKTKKTTHAKNRNGFYGLFGSLIKRLKNRSKNSDDDDENGIKVVSVKEILRWNSFKSINIMDDEKLNYEEKSVDLETSSVCSSCRFSESPFRFVLTQSPSSGHRTPEFSSPALSPPRLHVEGKVDNGIEGLRKQQGEEEEEKQQCSPVSVLDPTFHDDDHDDHVHNADDDDDDQSEDNDFDPDCSFAIVQRAQKQLLQKLQRFERLAELDPVELEKRMLDHDEEIDDDGVHMDELDSLDSDENISKRIIDELNGSTLYHLKQIQGGMNILVSDLIEEERKEQDCYVDGESMAKRVCMKLESWKEVEFNTIDMMVELDYRRELHEWKRNERKVDEIATEIELGIFGLLVEELYQEPCKLQRK